MADRPFDRRQGVRGKDARARDSPLPASWACTVQVTLSLLGRRRGRRTHHVRSRRARKEGREGCGQASFRGGGPLLRRPLPSCPCAGAAFESANCPPSLRASVRPSVGQTLGGLHRNRKSDKEGVRKRRSFDGPTDSGVVVNGVESGFGSKSERSAAAEDRDDHLRRNNADDAHSFSDVVFDIDRVTGTL